MSTYPRRAVMTVQRENAEDPAFLAQVAPRYGIAIINNGTLTREHIERLRDALAPPHLVLVYENLLDGAPFVHNSDYDVLKRPILTDGLVPGWSTGKTVAGVDIPGFVLRPPMAAPLALLFSRRIRDLGADGGYTDQGFARYPAWVRNGLRNATGGNESFVTAAAEDFVEARMLFSMNVDSHGLHIMNSRTETADPWISGISLESVSDALAGMKALAPRRGASIVWDNTPAPVLDILAQLEHVFVGTALK